MNCLFINFQALIKQLSRELIENKTNKITQDKAVIDNCVSSLSQCIILSGFNKSTTNTARHLALFQRFAIFMSDARAICCLHFTIAGILFAFHKKLAYIRTIIENE